MPEVLLRAVQFLGLLVLMLAAIVLFLLLVLVLPWDTSWDVWAALTAIGTMSATFVAIFLALRSWQQDKDSTARYVSAWVTDEYQPRGDGSSYRRFVKLHIGNESNEPVYNAEVGVHIGRQQTSLGPLVAPSPISVIPPRRELVFDISIPLLAHRNTGPPRATLTFTDPKNRRWFRTVDGELQNISGHKMNWSKTPKEGDIRQVGRQDSSFNPMIVAMGFLAALRDEDRGIDEVSFLLASEASGWDEVNWDVFRADLMNFQPTSMVAYPAPRIARIKLLGDKSLEGRTVEGKGSPIELKNFKLMTLILHPSLGWRIFGIGDNVPPDEIHFGGSLVDEVEPY